MSFVSGRRVLAAVLLVVVLGGAACGSDGGASAEGIEGKDIKPLDDQVLPDEVLGLRVSREDVRDALTDAGSSYVEAAALFGFRREELLQATLQASRLGEEARPEDPDFRSVVVNQIGGVRAQQVRVGDHDVYLTRGSRQRIAVWFTGDQFFILSTREDFDQPRTLLRRVLEEVDR